MIFSQATVQLCSFARRAYYTHRDPDEHLVHKMKPLGGPVRELTSLDRLAYEQHLLALGPEDRRLRFGTPPADSVVRASVARIDFERDALFGVFSDDLTLVGAAHLARGDVALFDFALKALRMQMQP